MAELISERIVSSVRLLTVELSEDEVDVYITCLNYILEHYDDEAVERICGAHRDEVEGMRDDLVQLLDLTETEPLVVEHNQ
jgi:hypothetical protein